MPTAKVWVSIHAPTRGATAAVSLAFVLGGFNPRAHAGRDKQVELHILRLQVSIHAPTRGATP